MKNKLIHFLQNASHAFILVTGVVLLVLVSLADYMAGHEVTFSLFYLGPVSMVAWFSGRGKGMAVAMIAAGLWGLVDLFQGHHSAAFVLSLNFAIRASVFAIVVSLLCALQRSLEKEKEMARTDFLTGASSARAYFELVEMEIARSRRYGHPFTVAYVDLDNFKEINDTLGHPAGDEALCEVVSCFREGLREMDVVARLGGDEFALLLPETGEEEAKRALPKVRESLLREMEKHGWPVTFSIGVVVCNGCTFDAEQLVKMVDEEMYAVKKSGKNSIRYSVIGGK